MMHDNHVNYFNRSKNITHEAHLARAIKDRLYKAHIASLFSFCYQIKINFFQQNKLNTIMPTTRSQNKDIIKDEFICPLSKEPMEDPVMVTTSGITYEPLYD